MITTEAVRAPLFVQTNEKNREEKKYVRKTNRNGLQDQQ